MLQFLLRSRRSLAPALAVFGWQIMLIIGNAFDKALQILAANLVSLICSPMGYGPGHDLSLMSRSTKGAEIDKLNAPEQSGRALRTLLQ